MNYSRQKLAKIPCNDIAIVPELFCLSWIPTESGEPLCYDQGRLDRKRVAYVPCSIKFSLNHFLWTLYVNTAFLRCVASGYCDERAGIKIYCTVLSKYWMVWFKSYSILKMSGIGGSFILYNNTKYCTLSAISDRWIQPNRAAVLPTWRLTCMPCQTQSHTVAAFYTAKYRPLMPNRKHSTVYSNLVNL